MTEIEMGDQKVKLVKYSEGVQKYESGKSGIEPELAQMKNPRTGKYTLVDLVSGIVLESGERSEAYEGIEELYYRDDKETK